METPRARNIVAVFGSTESGAFPLARRIGVEISTRGGYILLTGGTGSAQLPKKEQATVKEQAILGAKRSAWIGVTRGSPKPSHEILQGGNAIVVRTDLSHRRNCLEACICDAAIALQGNEGTISEAVFSLWLGKPVVFIGDTWKDYGLDLPEGVRFVDMVDAAFSRVGALPSEDAPLDTLFAKDALSGDLSSKANYLWLPSPPTKNQVPVVISDALKWLQRQIAKAPRGYFPSIKRYASVAAEYNKWVSTV